jgi:SP family sugar:H+ symporter-like MFS transporter
MTSTQEPATQGRSQSFVTFICGAAALGGFLFGFDTAVINGAVAAIQTAFGANSVQIGLAVSLALTGVLWAGHRLRFVYDRRCHLIFLCAFPG